MKYLTVEDVDVRLLVLGTDSRWGDERQALNQIREMLATNDSKILAIEKTLEGFRPMSRGLNYWLCGVDVKKWAGVTQDMMATLERRIEKLKPPEPAIALDPLPMRPDLS